MQQSMKSFVFSTTSTSVTENEECATKKPRIENTDSDMEISSDDEVHIIESTNINDPKISETPIKVEELYPEQQTNYAAFNIEPKFNESYYQTTSTNIQVPKIIMASNLIKNNHESSSTYDSSKDLLNVESDYLAMNNMPPTKQDQKILITPNNTCSNSTKNIENGVSHIQSKSNKSLIAEKNISEIFKEISEILTPSENEKDLTIQNNELLIQQKQNDIKQSSIEHRLHVQQNAEISAIKNMNNLFGEDSDDESKLALVDVKKKSLGVRLGMSSNVNFTNKTNKNSQESLKINKNKTEDPNNKQKKFELSNLVVKLLNPYYKNNLFKTKELFKFMARQIVHKLLESTSHPGKLIYLMQLKN